VDDVFFFKKKKRCVTEPDFASPLVMGQALGMSSFFSFFLFYSFDFLKKFGIFFIFFKNNF
jgi:hypothetical protein